MTHTKKKRKKLALFQNKPLLFVSIINKGFRVLEVIKNITNYEGYFS